MDMNRVANGVAVALLILASLSVLGNWANLLADRRNRRRGVPRHVSMVPLLVQLFAGVAAYQLARAAAPWLPLWVPALVALADPAFWELVYVAVARSWRR